MIDDNLADYAIQLEEIASKIYDIANHIHEDKYHNNISKIMQPLEKCKVSLELIISNLK